MADATYAPELSSLVNQQQCAPCFIGHAAEHDYETWPTNHRWIDRRDYSHLLSQLIQWPTPANPPPQYNSTLVVSGVIGDHKAWLANTFTQGKFPVDVDVTSNNQTTMSIRVNNASNAVLGEYAIKRTFASNPDLPLLSFIQRVPFPSSGAATIEIIDRISGQVLQRRDVTARSPTVSQTSPAVGSVFSRTEPIGLKWSANDADSRTLTATALLRAVDKNEKLSPLAAFDKRTGFNIPANTLTPGLYEWEGAVHDGVHLTQTRTGRYRFTVN